MANRLVTYVTPPTGRVKVYHHAQGTSNKLPSGRIDTRVQGSLLFRRGVMVIDTPDQFGNRALDARDAMSTDTPNISKYRTRLTNEALARFNGKVRYGKAELGVTIGSWRQSWDMIAKRGRQAAAQLGKVYDRLSSRQGRSQKLEILGRIRKREREQGREPGPNSVLETPANTFLEGEFGWLPLFSDMRQAFYVMSQPQPNGVVTGRGRLVYADNTFQGGSPAVLTSYEGSAHLTIAASVRVSNPNLWLLNMLGLLNLPGTAWDLVPWSFVVNMFTNMGQIANSVTSHYGLAMEQTSLTFAHRHLRTEIITRPEYTTRKGVVICTFKDRSPGPIPGPVFETRMPEVNMELGLIALSLAVQQVTRITRLFR